MIINENLAMKLTQNFKRWIDVKPTAFTCKTDSFEYVRLALWTKPEGNGKTLEVRDVQINRGSEASDIWTPPVRALTTEQQSILPPWGGVLDRGQDVLKQGGAILVS